MMNGGYQSLYSGMIYLNTDSLNLPNPDIQSYRTVAHGYTFIFYQGTPTLLKRPYKQVIS